MSKDASGKHIWVSSLTPFEYLCIEGEITSSFKPYDLELLFKEKFKRLDWPCGKMSFALRDDAHNFCCIDGNKIAFIFKIDSNAFLDKSILKSINKFS